MIGVDAGRGDRIRTCDPHTPSVMRYQAALRPDRSEPRTLKGHGAGAGHLVGRRQLGKAGMGVIGGAPQIAATFAAASLRARPSEESHPLP